MKKEVLLGITGGIAAYKMVEVASSLTKKGYNVHVVMTRGGTKFVTPLTFQNITHNPVETDLFSPPAHYDVKHISLADRADVCLIGPATANFIGKMANGIADDLLSTIVMATRAPILLAPSMNVNMYSNPVFQDNLTYLKEKGYKIIEPGSGMLACGYEGKGRLPEPVELVEHIEYYLYPKNLKGKKVLITAGPTREPLDPVRFLSNYSSGKMGYALARAAWLQGAEVTLISGPANLALPVGVKGIMVETAEEMTEEVFSYAREQDIIIMAAAVADYRPEGYSQEKIKKGDSSDLILKLKRNEDILARLGREKREDQLLIGFAAESTKVKDNAKKKLKKKNLNMIIANDISRRDIGFASDENQITLITKEGEKKELPKMAKVELAHELIDEIVSII